MFEQEENSKKILSVVLVDEEEPSRTTWDEFRLKLNSGGETRISIRTLNEFHPEFEEKYAIKDRDGYYHEHSALIKYVKAHNKDWQFHGIKNDSIIFSNFD